MYMYILQYFFLIIYIYIIYIYRAIINKCSQNSLGRVVCFLRMWIFLWSSVNITWYLGLLVLKCTKMIWVACDPSFFKRGLDAYCDCFWGSSCCVYMCLSISEMPCFITVFVGHCKNQRFWHANKMQPLCTSVCSTTNQWDRSWKYPTILGNCFGDAAANGGRRCSCPLDSIYIYIHIGTLPMIPSSSSWWSPSSSSPSPPSFDCLYSRST